MSDDLGGWGGRRTGAGRKPAWKSGRCKTVKLPETLVGEVLRYAHQLDAGGVPAGERDWDLLTRTIEEKAAMARQLRLAEDTAAVAERRAEELKARVDRLNVLGLEAYATLSDALVAHRKAKKSRGISVTAVEDALNALSGYQDAPGRKARRPVPHEDERWTRMSKLIDEKQTLEKVVKQQRADLAAEGRKTRGAENTAAQLQARIDEAVAVLGAAVREHEQGARRGASIKDVRSALGTLTAWRDDVD